MKKTYLNTLKPKEIIKRLKSGEVVKFNGWASKEFTIRMIDGVLVGIDEDEIQIGDSILIEKNIKDYYFEEEVYEEPFKITGAGLYKTHDGRKVFISHIKEGCCTGLIEGCNNSSQWQDDGKFFTRGSCQIDIVSKWED